MKLINLEAMTTEELIQLNKEIARIVKQRRNTKRQEELIKFSKGDTVLFYDLDGNEILGMVIRVNKKRLTVRNFFKDYEYLVPPSALKKATQDDYERLK